MNPTAAATESSTGVRDLAERFVEMCNAGKNFDVMRTMYAPDIVSVEGDGSETKGQAAVIKKSADWAANYTIGHEKVLGPYFNGASDDAGKFAVHFTFEVTPKSGGSVRILEEVALYTVEDGLITREQFFYAGQR